MVDLNKPDTSAYQAKITDVGVSKWVVCPYCGKRQFPITYGAVVIGQIFRCKGSKCKKEYEVNYPVDYHTEH